MTTKKHYQTLISHLREIAILESTSALVSWDQQTYMPKGGAALRAEQLSYLAKTIHEKFTHPSIGDLLSEISIEDPTSAEGANVREIKHAYDKATKLSQSFVETFTKTTSLAHQAWEEARKKSDFTLFEPWLEKIVDLSIQKAEAYGYEDEPYDALLDGFEQGLTSAKLDDLFHTLQIDLVRILDKIKGSSKKPDDRITHRHFDLKSQEDFGKLVAKKIGFDFDHGRLDIAAHPFTTDIGHGDTRITTRYQANHFNDSFYSIVHEVGHALYEMGLNKKDHFGEPIAQAASLGIHESQSRIWENMVGRSFEFWEYFFPQAKAYFPDALKDVSLQDFYGAVNFVKPSFIRVDADEINYSLHVILRFDVERALIQRKITVKELPDFWNDKFYHYFGHQVDTHANGCLQDVHWSAGLFGYFPTYTLGNLYAAQFFAKAQEDIPDLLTQFSQGEFGSFLAWLRTNIHQHGFRYLPQDLCKKVTGKALSHHYFIDYLEKKFSHIYQF